MMGRRVTYFITNAKSMILQMREARRWEQRMIEELQPDFERVLGTHDEWIQKEKTK